LSPRPRPGGAALLPVHRRLDPQAPGLPRPRPGGQAREIRPVTTPTYRDKGDSSMVPARPQIDTSVAHIARIQDYWLGGKDHFAADRIAGDEAIQALPDMVASVRNTRAFLGRTVRYLSRAAGIRQFLDIGTGIPTASNTHEV